MASRCQASPKVLDLLRYLLDRPSTLVTKEELFRSSGPTSSYPTTQQATHLPVIATEESRKERVGS